MTTPSAIGALALACACLTAFPTRAAELPDLGDVSRVSLSETRESALGGQIMRQVRSDKDYLNDAEINDYLNNLGDRLASANPNPTYHFQFFAVRDDSINAFALPGGFIGVHTGLIAAARNESELAGVLAHEIAHVTQNHIARMVDAQKNNTVATLAALAIAILAARSDQSQLGQAALATAQAMSLQNQLDFTREHEREADRVGLQTLASAGFDTRGMVTFFERLQMQGRVSESAAPAYLRTHPLTYERIADIQNRLDSRPSPLLADSMEFKLVRAKVRAAQSEPAQALTRHRAELADRPNDVEALYALVAAALRAGEAATARDSLARLEKLAQHPMVATLSARVALDARKPDQALDGLRAALRRHGTTRPLAEAYADTLFRAGRAGEAKQVVTGYLRVWQDDPTFLALLARANFDLGLVAEGHLAQAEALRQQDLLAAAIDQLESARKAGGDYYTQSIVDARLRDARDRLKEEKARDARAW
jgi:predicted Zn-dependent protease